MEYGEEEVDVNVVEMVAGVPYLPAGANVDPLVLDTDFSDMVLAGSLQEEQGEDSGERKDRKLQDSTRSVVVELEETVSGITSSQSGVPDVKIPTLAGNRL